MSISTPAGSRLAATDRRKQLLETALDVFSRKGFEGTTTKAIAAAAGVTEAIIFRHFPSKQALYQAVLEYRLTSAEMLEWRAQARACMERNDDAGLVRALVDKILDTYRRDPRLQRVLMFAALEGHEEALAHNRLHAIPIFEQLTQYISRRQSEGGLQAHDPGMVIAAVAGMASYFAMMTRMFGFDCNLPDEQVAEMFTAILMNGIESKDCKERV